MAPKPKPKSDTDETAADPDKNARLETYEQEVERASVESVAEHPEARHRRSSAWWTRTRRSSASSLKRHGHANLAAWTSSRCNAGLRANRSRWARLRSTPRALPH